MSRYLNLVYYTTPAYKYMMHYEMILSATGFGEFQQIYPANTRRAYNVSKIIIKRVMAREEWEMSPLKERDYIHPKQKILVCPKCIFFIEFSILWIMKWSMEVDNTSEGFSCLQRTLYTKFWNKLIQTDPEGKIHGQEIIDVINETQDKYQNTKRSKPQVNNLSPFKKITRNLHMKKGLISKSEAIAIYMEEVKRDLMKNIDIDIRDDISMAPASHNNDDDESCIAEEAQSANRNKEIGIDALLKRLQEHVEESSSNTACKLKGKVLERLSKESIGLPASQVGV
ncbi:hypothetical protein H5410_041505 [Solanum commersonii]|uniref:Uncharacterized protein n=1 Tax=Solanum commersonii TaxID=4109 RepID=A0A9J5XTT3_SOLCO|nr:hypothetical protein H5410_041505 [Solanum commersonii]